MSFPKLHATSGHWQILQDPARSRTLLNAAMHQRVGFDEKSLVSILRSGDISSQSIRDQGREVSPRRSRRLYVSYFSPFCCCNQVGAIRAVSSTQPILLKNIGDASISLIAWYILGHGVAFGEDVGHTIGIPTFFTTGESANERA